jgi:hypothetical protein
VTAYAASRDGFLWQRSAAMSSSIFACGGAFHGCNIPHSHDADEPTMSRVILLLAVTPPFC